MGSVLGRALFQALRAVATTTLHLLRSVMTLDVLFVSLGRPRAKNMSVGVVVLADGSGPLLSDGHDAEWARLDEAIDEARRIFEVQANVILKPASNAEMITSMTEPAPVSALDVGCNGRAYREGLTDAGMYFERHLVGAGGPLGYGTPITVYIVRDIEGKSGCSLGPLADYVTIDVGIFDHRPGAKGQPLWTLAHELGHACNLWHHGDTLMRPGPGGRKDYLKAWQKVLFRASKHVVRS